MYEIRYKDVDPDSGMSSTSNPICICDDLRWAEIIRGAVALDYANIESDPNREFYITTRTAVK